MKIIIYLKKFLSENTVLLKTVRTLIEVALAWAVTVFTTALAGTPIPVDVQVAMVAVIAALFAAIVGEIGKRISTTSGSEGTD